MIPFFYKKRRKKKSYLLYSHKANVVAKYGHIMYNDNWCFSETESLKICKRLNAITEIAMIMDCPTSNPFIPAKIFIAFVQNTAKLPMYM